MYYGPIWYLIHFSTVYLFFLMHIQKTYCEFPKKGMYLCSYSKNNVHIYMYLNLVAPFKNWFLPFPILLQMESECCCASSKKKIFLKLWHDALSIIHNEGQTHFNCHQVAWRKTCASSNNFVYMKNAKSKSTWSDDYIWHVIPHKKLTEKYLNAIH